MSATPNNLVPEEYALFPIDSITESPLNPRRTFDKAKLDELTGSIRTQGVLQPIVLRRTTKPMVGKSHEIIFGTRRYRAARTAGLTHIPGIVRQLDDLQVLEAMMVENLQREDVHPLEEADGFQALVRRGRTVQEIAAKIGRTEGFVYGRLKLCDLTPVARKVFLEGKINPTIATMIARIPVKKLQDEAAAEFSRGTSTDQAREYIQTHYMLRLASAPFSPGDALLHPEAGPCTTCQKNTGVQRELFADVTGPALCTDPSCFQVKVNVSWERQADQATRAGQRVLSPKENAKIFPYAHAASMPAPGTGYVDLADNCQQDPKGRRWDKLLGKAAEQHVVLARDRNGRPHELIPQATATKLLKASGHNKTIAKAAAKSDGQDAAWRAQEERRRQVVMVAKEVTKRAMGAIAGAVEEVDPASDDLWRLLCEAALDFGLGGDSARDLVARRGWQDKKKRPPEVLRGRLKIISGADLRGVVAELLLWRRDFTTFDVCRRACKAFKVDLDKIEKAVKAEQAQKAKAAPPAKKGKRATSDAPAEASP
jgi:ParB/RepB/Spo0J family partition protein